MKGVLDVVYDAMDEVLVIYVNDFLRDHVTLLGLFPASVPSSVTSRTHDVGLTTIPTVSAGEGSTA